MAKIENYEMPDELYYHQEHAWVRVEGPDTVVVGMNDMFQKTAGDIVYVDLPFSGDEVSQGDVCGKVQSSKWIGKLVTPISGEILEVNDELSSNSALINTAPYSEGWIMKIKPSALEGDLGKLYHKDTVPGWLQGEIAKAKKGS